MPERAGSSVSEENTISCAGALSSGGAKPSILSFKGRDAFFEHIDGGRDILDEQHLRDVLRTVRVPGLDREQDRGLGARSIVVRKQTRDQLRVVPDHAGSAPDLHPSAILVVHEEEHAFSARLPVLTYCRLPAKSQKASVVSSMTRKKPGGPPRCW